MKPLFISCARQITDADIVEIEKRLGFLLPEDYKVFLKECNNGTPKPDLFPIRNAPEICGPLGWLHLFFGVDSRHQHHNIVDVYEVYKERIPKGWLPIGTDPGNNLICISVCDETHPGVWFWDHNFETESVDYNNCYFIADSLNLFLESFCETRDALETGRLCE